MDFFLHSLLIQTYQHYKLYFDGTEIVYGRRNISAQYYENINTFRWYFRIKNDGSSLSSNDGSMGSWSSAKTIKWATRAYATNNVGRFHYPQYWDAVGGLSQALYYIPNISIVAYGA